MAREGSSSRDQRIDAAEVRLDGVCKTYGPVVAVDGVTLSVRGGEFLTLLGPSGSGKTTTLACVAGFSIPTQGEVFIGGRQVTFEPPFRRNVGMVFQNYALFPHMTVAKNLGFPLRMRKLPQAFIKERVEWALALVRLEGLAGRYPRQLSGGQQQRVALARAIVFQPRVLLMDEPLGALDKRLRQEMQRELKRLHRQLGVTIIYVTHDQEEALTMSDRIAVMRGGRLEQVGTPLELYETPQTRFVAEFIGETNLFEGTVISDEHGVLWLVTPSGLRLPIRPEGAREGDKVNLFVRPERVLALAESGGVGVPGEIVETVYLGDATAYVVSTDTGDLVKARRQNLRDADSFRVGARVTLQWDPDVAMMIRKE